MEPTAAGDSLAVGPLAVAGRQIDPVDPRSALRAFGRPRVAWSTGETTVVGGEAAVSLSAAGSNRFAELKRGAMHLFDSIDPQAGLPNEARPRLFGGFAFHDGHGEATGDPWAGFPCSQFVLPAIQLTETAEGTWLTATATGAESDRLAIRRLDTWSHRLAAVPGYEQSSPAGIATRRATPDRGGWRSQVRSALSSIERGDLRKVVLAQALSVDLCRSPAIPDVLSRLGETYPDCVRFLIEPVGAGTFFGATPEALVAKTGRSVRTSVLAGSTGRGDTPTEDEWLAKELEGSEKDRREHDVVREAVREQLEPFATSIRMDERTVRTLATVQHLETNVRATLAGDTHVLDLVEALHPTPAVGGMPQDAALRTIREAEAFDRGWYASPVGWVDADGDGRFAVAIRSAVARDRTVTLFAGAGIVEDSDPDREWGELQLKYRPVLDELE